MQARTGHCLNKGGVGTWGMFMLCCCAAVHTNLDHPVALKLLFIVLCLLQIAVPSRTDVPEYQKLRSMVHEIVGRINGAFGTLTYVPIHHLDRQLSFHELCALYAVTGGAGDGGWSRLLG